MTEHDGAAAEMLPGLRDSVRDARARSRDTRARKAARAEPAAVDPVARVLVDLPLAHLDRPFDYVVPAAMGETAVPGARVKVRFAGQDVDGFVVERTGASDHAGRLQPLRRVVSPEPVLSPEVLALAGAVAERVAGVRADVLRLAVPPRHAGTEKRPSTPSSRPRPYDATAAERAWREHEPGAAFLRHLADGGSPRAVWGAAPATDWPTLLAHAAAATRAGARGVLLCVPDRRDVDRVDRALREVLGPDQHVVLTADQGPAARYRDFLAVRRGAVRVVVGTRAAAFAPVQDLGLAVVWDDGDDLWQEPRAPYPHAREVLRLRADLEECALLLGGFGRSVEAQEWVEVGRAHEIAASRETVRERATVTVAGASEAELRRDPHARAARIPSSVHSLVRTALTAGPVLVQAPRSGYAAALACDTCRVPARCRLCRGPLRIPGPATPPSCSRCGAVEEQWRCDTCGGRGLRAPVLGDARTAEELGRAFPGARILSSSGDHVLDDVPDRPALVVATPGAEPVADGGYAAVVLLDTWLPLARNGLRAPEEALRRWLNAAGLVRAGGHVAAVGDPQHPALQALVRWDPAGFARREARERREARLPPAARVATITGRVGDVDDVLTLLAGPSGTEVLGPVPDGEEVRYVVRSPAAAGTALVAALGEVQRVRSARKLQPVRIQVDPVDL